MPKTLNFLKENGRQVSCSINLNNEKEAPGVLLFCDGTVSEKYFKEFIHLLMEDGYSVLQIGDPSITERDMEFLLLEFSKYLERGSPIGAVGFGTGSLAAIKCSITLGLDVLVSYWPETDEGTVAILRKTDIEIIFHLTSDDSSVQVLEAPNIYIHNYTHCDPGFALSENASYDKWASRISYSRTLNGLRRNLGPKYKLAELFQHHLKLEFEDKDADATMETMVDRPYVNHIPTQTGGVGYELLKRFYKYHFIPQQPSDRKNVLISETVGSDTVVLEIVNRFTHDTEMDHMLPGIAPTGMEVELPVVVIAKFRGKKLYNEHIYWDQASLLKQIGLLDGKELPISGRVSAHKLMDENLPSNELMEKWKDSEDKLI